MKRWAPWALIGLGIVALISLGRQLRPTSGRQSRLSSIAYDKAVAFTFGKLIHDSLPGNGDILFVQWPGGDAGQEAGRQIIKALATGLGSSSSRIVDVTPYRLPPAEQGALTHAQWAGAWAEQFLQWVDREPRPRAIVSFIGLPRDLSAEKIRGLPPLLAFGNTGGLSVDQWLTRRNVFAWVVPRNDVAGLPPQSGSPEKVFNAGFELRLANR